jgi:hypothetical protein
MAARSGAVADLLLREDALREMKQVMSQLTPEGLTGVEILAVLAILRGAKERIDAQRAATGVVLQLCSRIRSDGSQCFSSSGPGIRSSDIFLPLLRHPQARGWAPINN